MDWVDKQEEVNKEKANEGYFKIEEGDNRVQILTYTAPLAQIWDAGTKRYKVAEEGEKATSIKGVCWLLQDGKIKQAKLPYTVVKQIRALQTDSDWQFTDFPMPRVINIKAKGAGTKEVEYSVVPSPKETAIPDEVLKELSKKPSPDEIVEKIKSQSSDKPTKTDYPRDDINPEDIPF